MFAVALLLPRRRGIGNPEKQEANLWKTGG